MVDRPTWVLAQVAGAGGIFCESNDSGSPRAVKVSLATQF
jgi:hypothetical protein